MPPARRALAALSAVAALSACLPGARPPAAPVRSRLSLDPARSAALPAKGPLTVAFASPRGDTDAPSEVTVVFDRPMRSLALSPHEPAPPAILRPAAPGSWEWVGTTALRFTVAQPLPAASAFRVEIPAGTRALDGSELAQAFSFEFSTQRPAIARSSPEAGEERVAVESEIELGFNLPVGEAEVARAVSMRAGREAIAFRVERVPKSDDRSRVRLVPRAPLPRASEVRVRVDASLRAEEGTLPAGKAAEIAFRTIAPPSIVAMTCVPHPIDKRACSPAEGITLQLSTPLSGKALARAIEVEPRVKLHTDSWPWNEDASSTSELTLNGDFEPDRTYQIHIRPRPDVRDDAGQPLAAGKSERFRFGDLRPDVTFVAAGTYWTPQPGRPRVLPVHLTNVCAWARPPSPARAPISGRPRSSCPTS